MNASDRHENVLEVDCPFTDCDWSRKFKDDEHGRHLRDAKAKRHYETEHAGKARVQAVVEKEVLIGDRDPHDLSDRAFDELEDEIPGYEVAYTRTEIIEEPDDHSKVEDDAGD